MGRKKGKLSLFIHRWFCLLKWWFVFSLVLPFVTWRTLYALPSIALKWLAPRQATGMKKARTPTPGLPGSHTHIIRFPTASTPELLRRLTGTVSSFSLAHGSRNHPACRAQLWPKLVCSPRGSSGICGRWLVCPAADTCASKLKSVWPWRALPLLPDRVMWVFVVVSKWQAAFLFSFQKYFNRSNNLKVFNRQYYILALTHILCKPYIISCYLHNLLFMS